MDWRKDRATFALCVLGFGCCIASTESYRYTGIWFTGIGDAAEMVASVLATLIGIAVLCFLRSRKITLWQCRPLVWTIATLHVAALITRMLYAEGVVNLPHSLVVLSYALAQSGGIMFLIYASLFFETGFGKSIPAIALGFVLSGALQIVALTFYREIALCLILLFAPLSALMILLLGKRVVETTGIDASTTMPSANESDSDKDAQWLHWIFYAVILLIAMLLKDVQYAAVPQLDDGRLSSIAQGSIGLGGILSGLFVLAMGRRVDAKLLVFPMLIAALVLLFFTLYLSVLVRDHAWIYLIFQGICYTTLFFLTLVVSSATQIKSPDRFIQTCIAFLAFRVGLSFGTIAFAIAPETAGDLFKTALTLVLSTALVVLCATALLKCLKSNLGRGARDAQADPEDTMAEACRTVAQDYALTPRETEVLFLLAKGRNAQHIAKTLTLSPGTVKTHTAHIYQKVGVQSQQALMDIVERNC